MKLLRGVFLLALAGALLSGCGDDVFLVELTISPDAPSIFELETQQFTATGTTNTGVTVDSVPGLEWSSSDTTVVTIDDNGLATCVNDGTSTITATAPVIPGAIATVSDTTTLTCLID